MVMGYQIEETIDFETKYMVDYFPTTRRVWDNKVDPIMAYEMLEEDGKPRTLLDKLRN